MDTRNQITGLALLILVVDPDWDGAAARNQATLYIRGVRDSRISDDTLQAAKLARQIGNSKGKP